MSVAKEGRYYDGLLIGGGISDFNKAYALLVEHGFGEILVKYSITQESLGDSLNNSDFIDLLNTHLEILKVFPQRKIFNFCGIDI